MKNYSLTLCYDGTRYKGWQKQGNTDSTIQEKLEKLLSRLLKQDIEVAGSGRTDAGVHARRQVCSFRAETGLSCEELLSLIRQYLPEDIGAAELHAVEPRFHARLSCREKTYVYRVWNSSDPNVFERRYMCSFPDALDVESMRAATAPLLGTHDFTAFCSDGRMKKSAVRTVKDIRIDRIGNELRFELTGDGFLYNMVRIIVGTLLEVGLGKRSAASVSAALEAKDRALAGPTAPAHGLILWDVRY